MADVFLTPHLHKIACCAFVLPVFSKTLIAIFIGSNKESLDRNNS